MTQPQSMPTVRRRIPGMTNQGRTTQPSAGSDAAGATTATPAPEARASRSDTASNNIAVAAEQAAEATAATPPPVSRPRRAPARDKPVADSRTLEHRRARDYATTRLVNFRIPVDLHDRFKRILRDVEDDHPRLRHPNLTELLIGLLEEGPQTADEVAGVIRRKRAAEHSGDDS